MFLPFNQLPDSSRIWIYQGNRVLTDIEVSKIKTAGEKFVNEWTAHQQTLHASFEVLYNLFLILAVDEKQNDASGCSIDKSVYFIRQIENDFKISLLDRFNIALKKNDAVEVKPLYDFLKFFKEEKNSANLPVFNNLIQTKGELLTSWEIPVSKSWIMSKL
ncbi:MAG: ABC transporter ATPase [Bacteroidia bacterium]